MPIDKLIDIYRELYWRYNEYQLIACDFQSEAIDRELSRHERVMHKLVERIGFVPVA